MKAIVFHEHGDLDKLVPHEMDAPTPGPGEVQVRVKACALNHLDIWVRLGGRPAPIPMPHILGSDIAGEISALGTGVEGLRVGQRVVIAPGVAPSDDEFSRLDNDSASDRFQIMGFQRQGGYAEYAVAPACNIIPVSDRYSMAEWASIPLVFLTSWHMLFHRAKLQPGETVLIHAAGSGLGVSAIQLAKLAGATVITTAGSDEKLQKARELGADEAINYRERDFVEETLRLTDGRGVDVVYEHIGGETFEKSIGVLRKTGRLVFCGVTAGIEAKINIAQLFMRQISLHGSYMGSLREMKAVMDVVERGRIKPVVDSVFPLNEARAAQQRMLDRKNFGKIVLEV